MFFLNHQKEPKNGAQTAGKRNSVSLKFRFGREIFMTHNTGRCFSKIFRVGTSQTSLQAPNPKHFVAHPKGMCGASSKSLPRKFEKVANTPHAGCFRWFGSFKTPIFSFKIRRPFTITPRTRLHHPLNNTQATPR